jgi:hypothetical protein
LFRLCSKDMPLVHGQDISAGAVESEVSTWDAVRFARLCNAIAWAMTWSTAQSVPAFTERVNVADNGIDAEWYGEFGPGLSAALLRSGVNVFQYKKREAGQQTRSTIASTLKREVDGAVADIERRTGKQVASYVFFTNVDLTTAQQDLIRESILTGADEADRQASVIAAAELAATLNLFPHLRSAFFSTAAFRTWGDSWDRHRRERAFAATDLFGRDEVLAELQSWMDDSDVQVIALCGPHMMGKTRLALEATKARDVLFVEALGRQDLSLSVLAPLASPGRQIVVLVNDPDPEAAQDLARDVLSDDRFKVILCVATAEDAPAPNFGMDDRVRQLTLRPLDEAQSLALLKASGPRLDFGIESWIVDNAGGVPGVLLAAGHVGSELRTKGESFLSQVAAAFQGEVRRRCTPDQQAALAALSVMTHVGVTGRAAPEAVEVANCFNLDLNTVLNAVEPLCSAGFLRLDGSYAEVVPPPLANRVAGQLIRGRADAVRQLLGDLSPTGRRRLLRRLVMLPAEEATAFWAEVLSPDGAFSDLAGLAANSKLFGYAAAAAGEAASRVLGQLLAGATVADRLAIAGGARRDLVHAIEEMLFRSATSESALRSLSLLAEAENESWGNNSAGIFREVFHPLHTQMPLPLVRRIDVLRDLAAPGGSETLAVLAVNAAAESYEDSAHTLRHTIAAGPLGKTPDMTWNDVWDYQARTLELLDAMSRDPRTAVRRTAAARLPRATAMMISRGLSDSALPILQSAVDRALGRDPDVQLWALADDIDWCRGALETEAHGGEDANAEIIAALDALFERLSEAPFASRLRLWVGGWFLDRSNADSPTETTEMQIRALAAEASATPELLTDDLVAWLVGEEAKQAGRFWWDLGHEDGAGAHVDRVAELADHASGAATVVNYLMGWNSRDTTAAAAFFRRLADRPAADAVTLLIGALEIEAPEIAADKVAELVQSGRIDPRGAFNRLLHSRWVSEVPEVRLVEILDLIVALAPQTNAVIPELIGFRHHTTQIIDGPLVDLGWRAIAARPEISNNDAWHIDNVAGRMAPLDPDRAFAALQDGIRDIRSKRWNPIAAHWPNPRFWPALIHLDRARALQAVLEVAAEEDVAGHVVSWHIHDLVDLVTDQAALLDFASRGEAQAMAVCSAITGSRQGFWTIAFGLVDLYPRSEAINAELESRVEQMGQMIRGPMSDHYGRCIEDVNQALQLPAASAEVLAWLTAYRLRLEDMRSRRAQGEADDRVNDR